MVYDINGLVFIKLPTIPGLSTTTFINQLRKKTFTQDVSAKNLDLRCNGFPGEKRER